LTSQQPQNSFSSISFTPKTEINANLLNEVNRLLNNKLAEHLHLLDDSDMEDEPYLPTDSTPTISNNQSGVTSTAHSESSDSDLETDSSDSDSDSSSSGTDSSDDEEEPKTPQHTKTKTTGTDKRHEEEEDGIILLDHNDFKDDITTPEETTIHVNCYVTRDIMAKEDQSKHIKITALVTEGNATSYLQGSFYADLTSKARQAYLQYFYPH